MNKFVDLDNNSKSLLDTLRSGINAETLKNDFLKQLEDAEAQLKEEEAESKNDITQARENLAAAAMIYINKVIDLKDTIDETIDKETILNYLEEFEKNLDKVIKLSHLINLI